MEIDVFVFYSIQNALSQEAKNWQASHFNWHTCEKWDALASGKQNEQTADHSQ